MTFLAPGFLLATLVAAVAAVALHFIAWRRPDDLFLPTARFVPDQSSRRSARAARPSDLPLLLLRLVVLGLVGVALARPVLTPRRAGVARVVAVDRSSAGADFAAARDSALAFTNGADAAEVIVFDSVATVRSPAELRAMDSSRTEGRGSLSVALVTMLRRAEALRARHDRIELAIVSPFPAHLLDAATLPLRDLWPDSIRTIRVSAAAAPDAAGAVDVRAPDDDPVAAGVRLAIAHGLVDRTSRARLVRGALTDVDSAWVRDGDRVLVHWPDAPGTPMAREGRTDAAGATALTQSVRGILVGNRTVVGHLRAIALDDTGAVAARWLDGTPAARQTPLGRGCVRRIGFDVPREGDFTLSPAFRRVAAALLAPCDGAIDTATVADTLLRRLAAGASEAPRAAPTRSAAARAALPGGADRLRAGLLALAIGLALLELRVRRHRRGPEEDRPTIAGATP